MVEYMMRESGISMEEIDRFYAAGAFGKHVSKESAITIGMYPDMDRSRLICAGNTSLAGAEKSCWIGPASTILTAFWTRWSTSSSARSPLSSL